MIPKKIHYCWFGGKELPDLAIKCIESWKKYCPDYEIIRWDENSFPIESNCYVKEAYESKKFAFVTDFVRLYAIYNYGGIYMDTDVEVCQSIDEFLFEKAFSGFESYTDIPTGIMAGEQGLPIYKELLDYYTDRHFLMDDGVLDLTTNVQIFTDIFTSKGLIGNNTKQTIEGYTFYPKTFFCPNQEEWIKKNNKKVYTIHHFAGSWLPDEEIKKRNSLSYKMKWGIIRFARKILIKIFGKKRFEKMRGRG